MKQKKSSTIQAVDALLQGRAAGVQVIGNDGNPGGAASLKLWYNSLRGNNGIICCNGIIRTQLVKGWPIHLLEVVIQYKLKTV